MIPVQNIYFMLSYAFKILKEDCYKKVDVEECASATELCSAILERAITLQLKRGLERGYVQQTEMLNVPKGKIEVSQSIREMTHMKKQIVCTHDEFVTDTYMNRILKSTVNLLLCSNISTDRKKKLRKLMKYFVDVELLDVHRINWHLQFNRNNQTYRMLINVCYLIIHGLLQTASEGIMQLMDYEKTEAFCRLYERFVYEYFKQEFPMLSVTKPLIGWQVDDGYVSLLPTMKMDMVLSNGERYLIVDTKAYKQMLQWNYDKATVYSHNLYQIFSYVKNMEYGFRNDPHEVSGMLLYAKTATEDTIKETYHMSGNRISVNTLNLNCHHTEIAKQLKDIVYEHFGSVS